VSEYRNGDNDSDEEALSDSYAGLAACLNLAARYDEALEVAKNI